MLRSMEQDLHATVAGHLRRYDQRYTNGRRALVEILASAGRPVTIAEVIVLLACPPSLWPVSPEARFSSSGLQGLRISARASGVRRESLQRVITLSLHAVRRRDGARPLVRHNPFGEADGPGDVQT